MYLRVRNPATKRLGHPMLRGTMRRISLKLKSWLQRPKRECRIEVDAGERTQATKPTPTVATPAPTIYCAILLSNNLLHDAAGRANMCGMSMMRPDSAQGGLGGLALESGLDPSRVRDMRLVRNAEKRWGIKPETKKRLVEVIDNHLNGESADDPRAVGNLGKLLVAMEAQNQADEHEAEKAEKPANLTQINIVAANGVSVDRANLIARLSQAAGTRKLETQS